MFCQPTTRGEVMAIKQKAMTTARQIRRRVNWLLVLTTLIMGLAVVGTVGYQLVKQSEQSSVTLIKSLKRSIIDDRPDWTYWRRYSSINTENTYVRVYNVHERHPKKYYSPNTANFLNTRHYQAPIFSAVAYTPNYGLTYYREGAQHGNRLQIWLNLTPITVLLISVILVVLLVMVLVIVVGGAYVRLMARQITRPLAELNGAAQEQAQSQSVRANLPVPDQPVEVHELASNFNQLLQALNQHAEQEREFTSNAAHELRTPIAAIRSHVQLVERRGTEHPEIIPKSIHFIDEESQRMQRLVNGLLTLSRADRGVLKLEIIDLFPLINETIEEERAVLKQPIHLEGVSSLVVNGNAESLQQVLTALIDNAGKYSPSDQPITIRLSQTATTSSVTIQDFGNGIPDKQKTRIFDRFYRVDSSRNRKIGGTGLGLAIVAQLVRLNHGEIRVIDNVPRGSQFILSFSEK